MTTSDSIYVYKNQSLKGLLTTANSNGVQKF